LGEVTAESAQLAVDFPEVPGGNMKVLLHFDDGEGGGSLQIGAEDVVRKNTDNAVSTLATYNRSGNAFTNREVTVRRVTEVTEEVATKIVGRISKCDNPAENDLNGRYCPAMNRMVFDALFELLAAKKKKR